MISVGATTLDRCLAGYSNVGAKLDLVAPGGGDDAALSNDPDCHPFRNLPPVHQETFLDFNSLDPGGNPDRFGFPGSYGTSMAAPEVSATAALVIASRVLGSHPYARSDTGPSRADGDAARWLATKRGLRLRPRQRRRGDRAASRGGPGKALTVVPR